MAEPGEDGRRTQLPPPGAICARHAGRPATLICARCGNFMCAACACQGEESRCPRCRPAETASLRAERLQNALGRSPVLTCRRCGYAGRKLSRRRGFKWYDFATIPALFLTGFGIAVVPFLISIATPACPGCGSSTELQPEVGAAFSVGAEDVWRAAADIERRRMRRHVAGLAAAVAIAAAIVAILFLR